MNIKTFTTSFIIALFSIFPALLSAQNATCPPNLGFEDGNLANWHFFTGSCCPTNTSTASGAVPNRHTLTSGTGMDPYGNFPVVAPGGGNYSLRLGNATSGGQAERARYYIQVPNNQNNIYTLLYSYAVVFQNPGHSAVEQPRFEVNVFDSATGDPAPCNQFTFVSSASLPGFQHGPGDVLYKPWATSSIDLSAMAGRTVAIDFTSGDCSLGGHFGYAYIDVSCNFFQSHTLYCQTVPTYTLSAPPGFETYEWRDASLQNVLATTENLTIPTPSVTTSFAVILKPYPGFGCPDTLFTTFSFAQMNVNSSPDTGTCEGDGVKIGVSSNSTSSPFTYNWQGPNLSCINCDSPVASPITTQKYYVTLTDKDGCKVEDSLVVRVDKKVSADIVMADSACAFDGLEIINDANNPSTADYLWNLHDDNGTVLAGSGTDTIIGSWTSVGLKKVKLGMVNGLCADNDSTYVYIMEKPLAEFEIDRDVCLNAPVSLYPYPQTSKYQWTIDGHSITDSTYKERYTLQWDVPGLKKIVLKLFNEAGCEGMKESTVGVHEFPIAEIIPVNASKLCKGKEFELSATAGYRYEYSWSPPQYFTTNGAQTVTGIAEQPDYVYLSVANQWHCVSTDSFFIDGGPCCDIFMPTAFTPNGDGHNDTYWSPDLNRVEIIHLMIANRRGQVVYETKSRAAWDGSYKGRALGQDTYNFFIRYKCNDEEIEKKGTLTLIR